MNRKSDKENHPQMDGVPTEWYEIQRVVSKDSKGEHVSFKNVSCDEVSKQQLDPHIFDLTSMIENGTMISPSGDAKGILNSTDIADIQAEADFAANEIMQSSDNYNKNEKS